MHLLLCHLVDCSCLRAGTFTWSPPLCSLLGAGLGGSELAHRLALAPLGPLSAAFLHSPPADRPASVAHDLSLDEFEPFGPESHPGDRVLDLFGDHIVIHCLPSSSKEEDVVAYIQDLDAALHQAGEDPSCRVITLDVSVPENCSFQAAMAALVYARVPRWTRLPLLRGDAPS